MENKLTNYLPVNRKLFQHSLWKEQRTYSKFEAWLDLLQNARFENTEAKMLIGCKMVKWGRGQMPASLRFLATRWDWSTKKVTSFLSLLETEQMIKKETVKETGQTIITICKYDSYNVSGENRKHQKKHEGNGEETGRKREGNETNKEEEYKECLVPANEPEHTLEVKEKFGAFMKWVNENAPRVNQLKKPFNIDEYVKIKAEITNVEQLKALLLKMQNWAPLIKNNESSYLTLLNWYRRDTAEYNKAETNEKKLMKSIGL